MENLEGKTVHHKKRRRRSLIRRILQRVHWRLLLIVFLVMSVTLVGGQVVLLADAMNQLNSSFDSTMRVMNSISNKSGTELTIDDFGRLQTSINNLSRSLNRVDGRLRFLRHAAPLNPDWETLLDLLAVSQEMARATDNMLDGLEPALFYMVDGQSGETVVTQISSGERIVELLTVGRGRFNQADGQLTNVRTMLDSIDLSSASPELLLQVRSLNDYYTELDEINTFLIQAPDILTTVLGLRESQNYLVLAQNSDELRPSGGYISTYGWMTVRNGRIVDYDYYPTTAESPLPPAQPPTDFEVPSWWIQYRQPIYAMWDGSWYADFPRTAEMARTYYNLNPDNPNVPIHGVLAIDIDGFERILEALGSVIVPRTLDGETSYMTITSENFREIIYDIRADEGTHKAFIADIYNEIFSQWQSRGSDSDINQALLGAVLESLLEKHIIVYSADETINNAIQVLGWSGRQLPGTGHDYLMIADANLGNKSNSSIIRQTTYDVIIQPDDTVSSRLSIDYDYPDLIARNDPAVDARFHGPVDYNNLLQIFVPPQSELNAVDNFGFDPQVIGADEHTVFVSRVRVPYDTSQRYQVRYDTPAVVGTFGTYRYYRLLIQKQPGMSPEDISIQVSLPSNAQLIDVSPAPAATYSLDNLILDFRLVLTSDVWLEIIFEDR